LSGVLPRAYTALDSTTIASLLRHVNMVAGGSNFLLTVTLPVTSWFLDRGKRETRRADQVLFIDARKRQIDRAHRDFTEEQLEFLANIVRLYRDHEPDFEAGSSEFFDTKLEAGVDHVLTQMVARRP
jgi:type I restriction-modification system DNA methylase subunit